MDRVDSRRVGACEWAEHFFCDSISGFEGLRVAIVVFVPPLIESKGVEK